MSIVVRDLSYSHSNHQPLFTHLNFSVENRQKVSLVGNNGIGKSTLLQVLAGQLQPASGDVRCSSKPYYVPQHSGLLGKTVAEVLEADRKLNALQAILQGSVDPSNYDILSDDWEIETKCASALSYWHLQHVNPDSPMDDLSGGEKTKVYLAGLLIHEPQLVLLDEPTNHLDQTSRQLLYQYLEQSKATCVVVSHDVTLLNLLTATYELSEFGLKLYGGNYSFYKEQKEIEQQALVESIHSEEKSLRTARKKAQEVKQRQERRSNQGEKNRLKKGGARILINALGNSAENTASKLNEKHAEILAQSQEKIAGLKEKKERLKELKIDFDHARLHGGKLLIEASQINFAYPGSKFLWKTPLDFKLYSNDRIRILGDNGAGKTTFVNLLTDTLAPTKGTINRAAFRWVYLDQNYTAVDRDCTVEELAAMHNLQHLEEHEVKLRLNRFLFPENTWDKNCQSLSGGEKMRLSLCCLMLSNQTPDLIVLDEPTNNLDISSLEILTQTIKHYRGSLLVISHDRHFIEEIGITGHIELC